MEMPFTGSFLMGTFRSQPPVAPLFTRGFVEALVRPAVAFCFSDLTGAASPGFYDVLLGFRRAQLEAAFEAPFVVL